MTKITTCFTPTDDNKGVHTLANLDLAQNLTISEGVNKVCYTQKSTIRVNFYVIH